MGVQSIVFNEQVCDVIRDMSQCELQAQESSASMSVAVDCDRQTCTSTIMNDSPILHYLQRDIEF